MTVAAERVPVLAGSVFVSSSQSTGQYDQWIQLPVKDLVYAKMGGGYRLDASGYFILPVVDEGEHQLALELQCWQMAAADAILTFENQLGQ
jgi:hypothetical protein